MLLLFIVKCFPLSSCLLTSRLEISVENWFMRKLKDGEEKLPKSVSHTTVVVLLGNQLLFVIIFEDCTVLLAGAGIWWDGGDRREVRTG